MAGFLPRFGQSVSSVVFYAAVFLCRHKEQSMETNLDVPHVQGLDLALGEEIRSYELYTYNN